ncbi:MAG TPA: DUF4238 domain-containing protein [Thiobacillus sp.]
MSVGSIPKLHHYVPRFLLRRFGTGKKDHLHVFDKHKGAVFKKAASKLAAENGFYDFEFQGYPMSIESSLADLESSAASHIRRIVDEQQLHPMDPVERGELARFFAVQLVRTRAHLEMKRHLFSSMEVWLKEEGAPDDFFAPDPAIGSGENAERANMARMIFNAPKDFAPAIVGKDWVLLQTDSKHPYLIGDNPLTMHNMVDRGLRGNLGLMVEGIEIYFPLSPNLALGMWCPSHREKLVENFQRLGRLSNSKPNVARRFAGAWSSALDIVEAIQTGKPLMSLPENVEHFNSLQVVSAERFLFSSDGDFALVEDMIRTSPELRYGRRLQEASGKF